MSGGHRASAAADRSAARTGLERRRARVSGRRVQQSGAPRRTSGACATTSGRNSSSRPRSRPSIPRGTTCSSGSGAPARSRPIFRSRCGRCSRSCGARQVRFGVLSKERCTGDPGETDRQRVHVSGVGDRQHRGSEGRRSEEDLTSCPHCVKTIGDDYRKFGYTTSRSSTRRSSSKNSREICVSTPHYQTVRHASTP